MSIGISDIARKDTDKASRDDMQRLLAEVYSQAYSGRYNEGDTERALLAICCLTVKYRRGAK